MSLYVLLLPYSLLYVLRPRLAPSPPFLYTGESISVPVRPVIPVGATALPVRAQRGEREAARGSMSAAVTCVGPMSLTPGRKTGKRVYS